MTRFFYLPPLIHGKIYDYLDETERSNLKATNTPYFSRLESVRDRSKKIANFILENYDVVSSSLSNSELKNLFAYYPTRLVMIGETHNIPEHRYLSANLMEKMWNKDSVLQIEGGEDSLKLQKQYKSGQLQHLPEHIIDSAETWDINNEASSIVYNHSMFIIKLIHTTLTFFQQGSQFSPTKLSKWINNTFSEKLKADLYKEFPEIQKFPSLKKNTPLKNDEIISLKKKIHLNIHSFVQGKVSFMMKQITGLFKASFEMRNENLTFQISQLVFSKNKNGIFLAGSAHVKDEKVISEIKTTYRFYHLIRARFKKVAIPYLLITPKNQSITQTSIQESFIKIFNTTPINSRVKSNGHEEIKEKIEKLKTQKLQESKDTYLNLKNIFLLCDIAAINRDVNHYGLWLNLSLKCLEQELKILNSTSSSTN
jgi:hypothetical protein